MTGIVNYERQIKDGLIPPEKLNRRKNARYTFDPFDVPPVFSNLSGNGPASGAAGAINLLRTSRGTYEWHVKGAGQTLAVPVYDRLNGRGLDFSQDLSPGEGHELSFSPNITLAGHERGRHSYRIGVDKSFFVRLKVWFTQPSGLLPFFFGLIKHGPYRATLDAYPDYAGFQLESNDTTADIRIQTNAHADDPLTVDTTQDAVDGAPREFELRVTQQGRVVFLLDGKYPTVTQSAFGFEAGVVVRPASFFLHGPELAPGLLYQEFEAGYLPERTA